MPDFFLNSDFFFDFFSTDKKDKSKSKEKKSKEKQEQLTPSKDVAPNVKCVLVGDGAVGKTNLIVSYIQDRFIPEYVPTAFDKYNGKLNVTFENF